MHLTPIETGFLEKQELKTLYRRSGDVLHRGKLKRLLARPPYTQIDLAGAKRWNNKIVTLLNCHRISSQDGNTHWLCRLVSPPSGMVEVSLATAPETS